MWKFTWWNWVCEWRAKSSSLALADGIVMPKTTFFSTTYVAYHKDALRRIGILTCPDPWTQCKLRHVHRQCWSRTVQQCNLKTINWTCKLICFRMEMIKWALISSISKKEFALIAKNASDCEQTAICYCSQLVQMGCILRSHDWLSKMHLMKPCHKIEKHGWSKLCKV